MRAGRFCVLFGPNAQVWGKFSGTNPANWDMDFFLRNDFYEQKSRARPVLRVLGTFLDTWTPKMRGHKPEIVMFGHGFAAPEPLRARS